MCKVISKMEQQKLLTINSIDELFQSEIAPGTVISATAVPIGCWGGAIANITPLLMSDEIETIFVNDDCAKSVREQVKQEISKILHLKFGESIIVHGRKISTDKLFNNEFVSNKIRTENSGFDEGIRKVKSFENILKNVNVLSDKFQFVEKMIEDALASLKRYKKERKQSITSSKNSGDKTSDLSTLTKNRGFKANKEIRELKRTQSSSITKLKRVMSKLSRKEAAWLKSQSSREQTSNDPDKSSHEGTTGGMSEGPREGPSVQTSGVSNKGSSDDASEDANEENNDDWKSHCYICKAKVPDQRKNCTNRMFCENCFQFNLKMRSLRTNLAGRFAIVTGGRIKIGYQIVLKLLRDGCYVIATTRFPNDAVSRYVKEDDYDEWSHRLKIYPLDLLNVVSLCSFIDYVKENLPFVDILINNAAQTISRPLQFYKHLLAEETLEPNIKKYVRNIVPHVRLQYPTTGLKHSLPLEDRTLRKRPRMEIDVDDDTDDNAGKANIAKKDLPEEDTNKDYPKVELIESIDEEDDLKTSPLTAMNANLGNASATVGPVSVASSLNKGYTNLGKTEVADICQSSASQSGVSSNDLFPVGVLDSDGQQVDLRNFNSWVYKATDVPLRELLDVLTINTLAPFILTTNLKDFIAKSPHRAKFIVNVSAMEGQFHRKDKTMYHPHTNMAKAALNMLTRTSGIEYANYGIFMTAVDTGWVTDENPMTSLEAERRDVPLDCVDGASRVYHPIVHGQEGKEVPYFAVFLKDFKPSLW